MTRKLLALLSATALLVLAGCGGDDEPAATPGTNSATAIDEVTVGVIPIVDVAPIYLGDQKGFFTNRNIKLTLTPAQGGAAIVPGVVSGEFQFGFSNVISMMLAQANNVPIKIVSNGNNSTGQPGNDFGGVVVKGDSPIQSAADLAGKSVAANTLKNIVETTVRDSVRQAGADPSTVEFVELPFPDMPAALEAGRVDAVFVVEPFLTATLDDGGRVVASSFAEVAPNLTVAVYFTSTELATSNPDLVRRFTEAMQESLAYADAHPDEVRQSLSTYTQISPEVAAKLILPKWPADINRDSMAVLGELAVTDGLIPAAPDLDALLP